jgi:hypothetical protein
MAHIEGEILSKRPVEEVLRGYQSRAVSKLNE